MTDARRTDLNYGHFGEPVYDVVNQKWNFARTTYDALQLQSLGESQTLIPAQLLSADRKIGQNAAQRGRNVNQLVQTYPEVAPSSGLLSSLAETSEIIQETTAGFDPTISELLAFGRALHPRHHRKDLSSVPVIAFPGGPAGQLVRVVQLVPETVGWDGESNIKIKNENIQSRVQGLWSANGSRIQQLQFARSDCEHTEWLAVRYGGATSILRITLKDEEISQPHNIFHLPAIEDAEFRIELEHVVTLTARRSGGIPHADICFNPWNPSEIAVVDQSSRWSIWRIQNVNAATGVWKLAPGLSGQLDEPLSARTRNPMDSERRHDGWGAVKWISNGAGLIVCNRRNIACFELRDPPFQSPLMADLSLEKPKVWILNIQQALGNLDHVFVATTSRIFWMRLNLRYSKKKRGIQVNSNILLGWRHFRNEADVSLSMQIADLGSRVLLILHSCVTGLQTVFTLELGKSPLQFPLSVCDPYPFPTTSSKHTTPSNSLSLVLTALPHDNHSVRNDHKPHSVSQADDRGYYKYMTLNRDLSLQQLFLVTGSSTLRHPLDAPQSLSRQRARKSSHKVQEDFIVPDETPDVNSHHLRRKKALNFGVGSFQETLTEKDGEVPVLDNQRTINLEWLTDYINASSGTPFEEALKLIPSKISERMEAAVPGIVSLEELLDRATAVIDVEDDSVALEDLVNTLEDRLAAGHKNLKALSEDLDPRVRLGVGSLPLGDSLARTYDALVKSWILSLPAISPSQVRTRIGRMVRSIAGELQLADCGLRLQSKDEQREEGSRRVVHNGRATFTLAVRSAPGFSHGSRQSKEKSVQRASGGAISSPISEYQDYMPAANLPTPEPTPSVHSQASSFTPRAIEDPAIKRLQSLACVTSHPSLSPAMMDVLNHWTVGQNPDNYDWESSKAAFEHVNQHEEIQEEARFKKRQRKNRLPKEQPENAATPSSQLYPPRMTASQVERPSDLQYSSQPTLATGSQPQPGRFGSRKLVKKDKRPGFR